MGYLPPSIEEHLDMNEILRRRVAQHREYRKTHPLELKPEKPRKGLGFWTQCVLTAIAAAGAVSAICLHVAPHQTIEKAEHVCAEFLQVEEAGAKVGMFSAGTVQPTGAPADRFSCWHQPPGGRLGKTLWCDWDGACR